MGCGTTGPAYVRRNTGPGHEAYPSCPGCHDDGTECGCAVHLLIVRRVDGVRTCWRPRLLSGSGGMAGASVEVEFGGAGRMRRTGRPNGGPPVRAPTARSHKREGSTPRPSRARWSRGCSGGRSPPRNAGEGDLVLPRQLHDAVDRHEGTLRHPPAPMHARPCSRATTDSGSRRVDGPSFAAALTRLRRARNCVRSARSGGARHGWERRPRLMVVRTARPWTDLAPAPRSARNTSLLAPQPHA